MDYAAIKAAIDKLDPGLSDEALVENLNKITVARPAVVEPPPYADTVPLWSTIGDGEPFDHADVLRARGETWESKSIPNYQIKYITWSDGIVTVTTTEPHPFAKDTDINLVLSACGPDIYDGLYTCHIVNDYTVTYPMKISPPPNPLEGGKVSAWQVGSFAVAP